MKKKELTAPPELESISNEHHIVVSKNNPFVFYCQVVSEEHFKRIIHIINQFYTVLCKRIVVDQKIFLEIRFPEDETHHYENLELLIPPE
jgi:hypothetical protein